MTSQQALHKTSLTPCLDLAETYAALDPSGMRFRLAGLPRQCREAWSLCRQAPLEGLRGSYDKVVISGMGGSAIAGDLVADLASLAPAVPVVVARNLDLPFRLDERTLFISCSHSGNTAETLSMFRDAARSPADVLAITAGGKLAQEASLANIRVVPVNPVGEPRSAVGSYLVLLLGVLDRLGLIPTSGADVSATVQELKRQLRQLNENVPEEANPAKQLARQLLGRLVVVYGGGLFSGAIRRWKAQLNENAKVWAFYETIPECLHNSVESFRAASPARAEILALTLKPSDSGDSLQDRYLALEAMLKAGGIENRTIIGLNSPPLAQLLSMILLGDYVSYYLAILQGLDPSPTPAIDQSKNMLR